MKRLTLVLLVVLSACELSESVDESASGLNNGPRMGMTNNGLDPAALYLPEVDDVQAKILASNPSIAALLGRSLGKFWLYDAAKCALPFGTSVKVAGPAGSYTLQGLLGLAPAWTTRALNDGEKRWLMACLLAHVNGLGESVSISVRGPNPGISPINASEAQLYGWQEGAFYGLGGDPQAPLDPGNPGNKNHQIYACWGEALQAACVNPAAAVKKRLCTSGDPRCGNIVVVGRCKAVCTSDGAPNGYSSCKTSPGQPLAKEVVTSYLPNGTLGCPGE